MRERRPLGGFCRSIALLRQGLALIFYYRNNWNDMNIRAALFLNDRMEFRDCLGGGTGAGFGPVQSKIKIKYGLTSGTDKQKTKRKCMVFNEPLNRLEPLTY
jgi:hypothetical protein